MPEEKRNEFNYLIRLLQEMLMYAKWTLLDAEILTMVLGRVLIGGYVVDEESAPLQKVVAQEVIVNMIRFLLSKSEEREDETESNSE